MTAPLIRIATHSTAPSHQETEDRIGSHGAEPRAGVRDLGATGTTCGEFPGASSARPTGPLLITITSTADGQWMYVVSPYHPGFVSRARALGGIWNAACRAWRFDAAADNIVRGALRDVYGTDGADEQSGATAPVTLYVYVAWRGVEAPNGPVRMGCGLTLARAFDRDGGAKLGDGVAHLRGDKPTSSGSRKNWVTRLPGGCLLAIYRLNRAVAERALQDSDYVCLIGDGTETPDAVLQQLSGRADVR